MSEATKKYRHLVELLYNAIPQEDIKFLLDPGTPREIHGGTNYGMAAKESMVASYNNTRESEQEIIDWYERALMGVRTGGTDEQRNDPSG